MNPAWRAVYEHIDSLVERYDSRLTEACGISDSHKGFLGALDVTADLLRELRQTLNVMRDI